MTTVPACKWPILESKGMRAIFQKKDKKGKIFENLGNACDYRMHETARIYPDV